MIVIKHARKTQKKQAYCLLPPLLACGQVATRYDTSRDKGFRQLEQGGVMGPTMFREQLRTIFGARLTRGEVGGLVSAFDLHRDGMVDAKEFAFRC